MTQVSTQNLKPHKKTSVTDTSNTTIHDNATKSKEKQRVMRVYEDNHKSISWAADGYGINKVEMVNRILSEYFANEKNRKAIHESFAKRAAENH